MLVRSSLVVALLLGWFMFKPKQVEIVSTDKESVILQVLVETIRMGHMAPKPVDDEFSKYLFKNYLERIDGGKRYLTQADMNTLKKYEYLLDDQVNGYTFDFFDLSLPMLENGIQKSRTFFQEVIDAPMDFSRADYLETDPDKKDYPKNDAAMKEMWRENIQFEVMVRWVQTMEDQKKKENKEGNKTEEELKAEAVKEIKKRYTDFFDRMAKLRRSDRMETYLGTIANYFDPHTDYFSPKEKQDFDINMGGKLEGIGARLQTDGEHTKIFSIVVGGPAWKTKKMEDNDIILKVAQKGQPAVDIAGMRVDDVVQLVRGKKGTTVILTVKKKDNSITEIEIVRDEVQLEDSKAKSVILHLDGKINQVGYIHLPKFYSSFETEGGNSCAVDVADEVKKLKAQRVNGIILDLRDNSGGSLQDVVEMSGLFLKDGPIVQVKGRESRPFLYNDKDPEVQYDGPLIIMVNKYSASASEIIAAAMQDYNRAVIVGSNSTFGKGTVQRFYDLDRGVNGLQDMKPLGNVKMTVQKFYRVNGGSTQLKGVVPDIVLPDNFLYIESGENEYTNPMAWSEITPVTFGQDVVMITNKAKIASASLSRINQSKDFDLIRESAGMLKENKDETRYPLQAAQYRAYMNKREEKAKKFENLFKNDVAGMRVTNLSADLPKINLDESNKARNEEFIKDLKKDIYLEETLNIMRDMITMEKSFVMLQSRLLEQY
ncbi:MAG: carboxy terminal-processing peptidase [Saprospiraceae bacterium]|nr:carboxy terminal-processing peptidase [Saprospiraceae bacterium]